MTLREKLQRMRAHIDLHWDELLPEKSLEQVISLIDVALAAEEFRSFMELHHIDAEVVRALSRLDKALE